MEMLWVVKGLSKVDPRVGVEEMVRVAETRGFAAATGVNIVPNKQPTPSLSFICISSIN